MTPSFVFPECVSHEINPSRSLFWFRGMPGLLQCGRGRTGARSYGRGDSANTAGAHQSEEDRRYCRRAAPRNEPVPLTRAPLSLLRYSPFALFSKSSLFEPRMADATRNISAMEWGRSIDHRPHSVGLTAHETIFRCRLQICPGAAIRR